MQVVTAHVWRLRARHAGYGAAAAAVPSRWLARRIGAQFARVLGTADGARMTLAGAQPSTWAVIAAWPDEAAARRFENGAYADRWSRRSVEAGRLLLSLLASRGRWGGADPFAARPVAARPVAARPVAARPSTGEPARGGPVAALTRARIALPSVRRFWAAVPPIAAQLNPAPGELRAPGCRAVLGIGEAPLLWQGTLSVWEDADSLRAFAYGPGAHLDAVRAAPARGWFAEELFARFQVIEAAGSIGGAALSAPAAAPGCAQPGAHGCAA